MFEMYSKKNGEDRIVKNKELQQLVQQLVITLRRIPSRIKSEA